MSPLALLLRTLILAYRWLVSPVLAPACRFEPTCSDYAAQAIARHGALVGAWLALKRVARCHPWGDSGPDPVPEQGS
ncbi:MAG: membrane protein insertion efficiency factor YidD [Kiloniellales bacterium]